MKLEYGLFQEMNKTLLVSNSSKMGPWCLGGAPRGAQSHLIKVDLAIVVSIEDCLRSGGLIADSTGVFLGREVP